MNVGIIFILSVILIVLKAIGYINYSWFVILLPLIALFIFGFILTIIMRKYGAPNSYYK